MSPRQLYPEHNSYAPAPDGSHFLLVTYWPSPRLLFVPIRAGITEKDIQVVDLATPATASAPAE